MKVGTCNNDVQDNTHVAKETLTFDEIVEREGVYKNVSNNEWGDNGDRLIVLDDFDTGPVVLWYCPGANFLAPADSSHKTEEFIRMDNEEFCVGIGKI